MLTDDPDTNLNSEINPHHENVVLDISTFDIFKGKAIDVFSSEEIKLPSNFKSDNNGDALSFQQKIVKICACIFITLEIEFSSKWAGISSFIFKSVIVISVVSYLLSSEPSLRFTPDFCLYPACDNDPDLCPDRMICPPEKDLPFIIIENFTIIVFTIEYVLRVLTCWSVSPRVAGILPSDWDKHHKKEESQPSYTTFIHVLKFVTRYGNIIDLICILPYYIGLIFSLDNETNFRKANSFLILMRILRLFKALDFIDQVVVVSKLIKETGRQSGPALAVFLYYAFIMIILFSALIYLTEQGSYTINADYPDGAYLRVTLDGTGLEISPFTSIPDSIYYVIITCTTVGYGDLSPNSVAGRFIGSLCALLGIVSIAFPVGVLGSDFKRVYDW